MGSDAHCALGVPAGHLKRQFRTWISQPPFVRRTYVVTNENYDHDRVLCLRVGEDTETSYYRARKLAKTFTRKCPSEYIGFDEHNALRRSPGRFDVFKYTLPLAESWGDQATLILEHVIDHWF